MSKISPCLWFDGEAEEAAKFYVSLLADSRIETVQKNVIDGPSGKAGSVLVVVDSLDDNIHLSSRNLHRVMVMETREVDPVSLVRFDHVLLTRAAVTQFEEILA